MLRPIMISCLALTLLSNLACQTTGPKTKSSQKAEDLRILEDRMTGWFTSEEQHKADPDNYFNIHLRMVPIWEDRTDGPWLYVEQAAASNLEKPYRQRVYHLSANHDGTFQSEVLKLPGHNEQYAGAWQTPEIFNLLTPDDLETMPGCSVFLKRDEDGIFRGGTVGKGCLNNFGQAAYAVSDIEITPDSILSWDRGLNDQDEQVWGATRGGYMFKKQ